MRLAAMLLLLINSSGILGQVGTIRGNIFAEDTGEPLFLCNVHLVNSTWGIATDENGYFHLSKLDPGPYSIIISSVGYVSDTVDLILNPGQLVTRQVFLKPSSQIIREVIVSASKAQKQTQVQASMVQVTARELKRIPQIGAEPDLAQYLQTIPGFVHSGDQGGQLYIRGGSEIQNSFLIDGIPVYNPFHTLGMFSVVDSDILQSITVYSGGFPSDFGGRISSVMDTKTRDGTITQISGKMSVSTLGLNAQVEGPLTKLPAFKNSSFLFSGKTSLINSLAPVIYSYTGSSGIPYGFTDLFGKLTKTGLSGSKISLTGFRFSDQVKVDTSLTYDWVNYGLGCNAVIVPNNSSGQIRAALNYSSYEINWKEFDQLTRTSSIESIKLLLESVNYFGHNELKTGVETIGLSSKLNYKNLYGFNLNEDLNSTDLSIYIKYKMILGRMIVEPGIRGSYYGTMGNFIPEPRLGLKMNLTEKFRIKSALGYYSQNLASVRPDQDVVNYFSGFVIEPTSVAQSFGQYQVKNSLQSAWHLVAGIETEPLESLQITYEVYGKYFPQTITLNRNKRFPDDTQHALVPDIFTSTFLSERGWAYGTDLQVQYSSKIVFLQVAYSLAFVRKFDGIQYYDPHYDRRHNANLMLSYYFGKSRSPWELNARFNFGTGFPYTPVTSYYDKIDLGDYSTNSVLEPGCAYGVLFGETNSARLPVYHRLDLTLKRILHLKQGGTFELSFSIYNCYNRKNLFYFDTAKYQAKYQLPVLPVIGIKYIHK